MDQHQRDRQLAAEIEKLEDTVARAQQIQTALAKKLFQRTDDDRLVTATANGHGEIVDLRISDAALEHPSHLGALISTVVRRAWRTAEILAERAQQKYLPELATPSQLEAKITPSYSSVDYHSIDYNGDPRIQNLLAESMEMLLEISKAKKGFEGRFLSVEVGVGAGVVRMNLAGTRVDISIEPGAPRQVGLHRLAGQVVDALGQAELSIAEARDEELNRIHPMGEF